MNNRAKGSWLVDDKDNTLTDETLTALNASEVRDVRLERMAAGIWQEVKKDWQADPYSAAWDELSAEVGLLHPELIDLLSEVCAMPHPPFQVQSLMDYLKTKDAARRMLKDGVA